MIRESLRSEALICLFQRLEENPEFPHSSIKPHSVDPGPCQVRPFGAVSIPNHDANPDQCTSSPHVPRLAAHVTTGGAGRGDRRPNEPGGAPPSCMLTPPSPWQLCLSSAAVDCAARVANLTLPDPLMAQILPHSRSGALVHHLLKQRDITQLSTSSSRINERHIRTERDPTESLCMRANPATAG